MKFWIVLALIIFLFFLFPVLSGLSWPSSFDPHQLGQFLHKAWEYWATFVGSAFKK